MTVNVLVEGSHFIKLFILMLLTNCNYGVSVGASNMKVLYLNNELIAGADY